MKVLLIGEFSSFHSNLKQGLIKNGAEVILASEGDGPRNIERDIDLNFKGTNLYLKILKNIAPLKLMSKMAGFDIVQFIYPKVFSTKDILNNYMINRIIDSNAKSFLCSTGTDPVFWHVGKPKLRYNPLDDWKNIDIGSRTIYAEKMESLAWNRKLAKKVNGIIPTMYEYKAGYEGFPNLKFTIPLPLDVQQYDYFENKKKGKLKLFHGKSRPGYKGSAQILKAMNMIKERYPNEIELLIPERLSFKEYIIQLSKANIVLDQINSLSWGYNAIIAMAMGKVVLSGCEPEALNELNLEKAPIINIEREADKIFTQLEILMGVKANLIDLGEYSRKFVENFHESKIVAKRFLSTWEEN